MAPLTRDSRPIWYRRYLDRKCWWQFLNVGDILTEFLPSSSYHNGATNVIIDMNHIRVRRTWTWVWKSTDPGPCRNIWMEQSFWVTANYFNFFNKTMKLHQILLLFSIAPTLITGGDLDFKFWPNFGQANSQIMPKRSIEVKLSATKGHLPVETSHEDVMLVLHWIQFSKNFDKWDFIRFKYKSTIWLVWPETSLSVHFGPFLLDMYSKKASAPFSLSWSPCRFLSNWENTFLIPKIEHNLEHWKKLFLRHRLLVWTFWNMQQMFLSILKTLVNAFVPSMVNTMLTII